jgi:hypothetical protein
MSHSNYPATVLKTRTKQHSNTIFCYKNPAVASLKVQTLVKDEIAKTKEIFLKTSKKFD